MYRIGLVGCGGIGRAHLNAWKAIGVEIVAVVDLVEEKAKALAEQFGCTALTDINALPRDLDVVSVATPPYAHYGVTKTLLNNGYNVFCEKPLTMIWQEGEELAALAEAKGLKLGVGFKMRFEPIFAEAKKHIGEIGRLQAVSSTKLQPYNPRPETAWIQKTGAMFELSVHDFDLITYITGKSPKNVIASKVDHRFGWEREDAFQIMADYGDGVTAMLQGMYAVTSTFCFRDLTLTFLGDKGYMRVERPDRIIMHTDEYRVIEIPQGGVNAFAAELSHFCDVLEGKCESMLGAENGVAMTKFINEAYEKGI